MEDHGKISVLMSTYTEPVDYVEKALESILGQTYKNIELIIVLDNPDYLAMRRYIYSRQEEDKRIVVIQNEKNIGLVKSLNKALERATGEYIARMDADDISLSSRFEKELSFLMENHLDLVGCNVTDIDESGRIQNRRTRFPECDRMIKRMLRVEDVIPHPTWLGKRSAFESISGYRSIEACEDYDCLVRLALAGKKLGLVREPLLQYRINHSGISCTNKALQKTSFFIVREFYRNGKCITQEEYRRFMESGAGKKKRRSLGWYYRMSSRLKTYRQNKVKFLFYGIYMFLTSREAREMIQNRIVMHRMAKMK